MTGIIPSMQPCPIANASQDVLIKIFSEIEDFKDMATVNLVCKYFKKVNESPSLAEIRAEALLFNSVNEHLNEGYTFKNYIEDVKHCIQRIEEGETLELFSAWFREDVGNDCIPPEVTVNMIEKMASKNLKSDASKLQAFLRVISARNSTDAIAYRFYGLLTEEMKLKINDDIRKEGNVWNPMLVNDIISNNIRGELVKRVVARYIVDLNSNGF